GHGGSGHAVRCGGRRRVRRYRPDRRSAGRPAGVRRAGPPGAPAPAGDWTGRGVMSSPRVALVLASSTGGIGRHVASLAEGLVRLGCDVAVYGPAATEAHFGFTGYGARFTAVEMPTGER